MSIVISSIGVGLGLGFRLRVRVRVRELGLGLGLWLGLGLGFRLRVRWIRRAMQGLNHTSFSRLRREKPARALHRRATRV